MRKNKQVSIKKPKTFKRVLTWCISILMLISFVLLIVLGVYLYTYEHNHPKYLINQIIEEYKQKNVDAILKKTKKDQRAVIKDVLPNIIDKDNIFAFQSYEDKTKIAYTVVNNNQKLSTIILEKEKQKALFGIVKLQVKSIEHFAAYPYKIHYFANTDITIDGEVMQPEGEVTKTSTQFAQLGLDEIQTYTYAYDRFEAIEDISASYQGVACTKVVDESGMDITFYPSISLTNTAPLQTSLTQFAKEYARYTTIRGVPSSKVLQYVLPNSSLAQLIMAYSNSWGEVSLSESFSEVTMTNPIQYYDHVYSYDVHLNFQIVADNGETKDFPINYRMYMMRNGNAYQVFDMERIHKLKQGSEGGSVASLIAPSLYVNDTMLDATCSDDNVASAYTFKPKETLKITSEQDIGAVYIKWLNKPKEYTMKQGKKTATKGKQGYLHELIKIKGNAKQIEFTNLQGNEMAEIRVYSKGTLPTDIQDWNAPYKKSDILAFPTHADDDALYLGALLSEYAAKGKKIQLVFLTNSNSTANTANATVRQHELLDGMWEMGLRAYPVVGEFQDFASRDLQHAQTLYDHDAMLQFQVASIRRFRPVIVVGHDENGEYGHGVHMLNTQLLKEAIHLSNESTYDVASVEQYGIYAPKKTYFHLYAQHQIVLDVHKKMDELNNLSPFEVASKAYAKHVSQQQYDLAVEDYGYGDCRLFGLYYSTVGYDVSTNDIFEGIDS